MQAETQHLRSKVASPVDILPVISVVRDHWTQADRAGFLQAMSSVANSVTVVTTDGLEGKFGQTVTSFCSVSADLPQMLCCIRAASPLRAAIERNGCFAINVLSECQSSIADAFAGRSTAFPAYDFNHIPHASDDNGCPTIVGASCLFSCRVADAIASGSHAIFVGNVTWVGCGGVAPLLYRARGYGRHVMLETSYKSDVY